MTIATEVPASGGADRPMPADVVELLDACQEFIAASPLDNPGAIADSGDQLGRADLAVLLDHLDDVTSVVAEAVDRLREHLEQFKSEAEQDAALAVDALAAGRELLNRAVLQLA